MIRNLVVLTVETTKYLQSIVHYGAQSVHISKFQRPSFLQTRDEIPQTSASALHRLTHGREEADVEDVGQQEEDGRHREGVQQVSHYRLIFPQGIQSILRIVKFYCLINS